MAQFKSKFPRYVDDAIRQAAAANTAPKQILAGLSAGTLPGLDGRPVKIAERTVFRKLQEARARLAAEPAEGSGPSLIIKLAIAEAARGDKGPDEIVSELQDFGVSHAEVAEVLAECVKAEERREEEDRTREQILALCSEGLTAEQIAETIGISLRGLHDRLVRLHYDYGSGATDSPQRATIRVLLDCFPIDKMHAEGEAPAPRPSADYGPSVALRK